MKYAIGKSCGCNTKLTCICSCHHRQTLCFLACLHGVCRLSSRHPGSDAGPRSCSSSNDSPGCKIHAVIKRCLSHGDTNGMACAFFRKSIQIRSVCWFQIRVVYDQELHNANSSTNMYETVCYCVQIEKGPHIRLGVPSLCPHLTALACHCLPGPCCNILTA